MSDSSASRDEELGGRNNNFKKKKKLKKLPDMPSMAQWSMHAMISEQEKRDHRGSNCPTRIAGRTTSNGPRMQVLHVVPSSLDLASTLICTRQLPGMPVHVGHHGALVPMISKARCAKGACAVSHADCQLPAGFGGPGQGGLLS